MNSLKVKKGDTVLVLTGKDKGKTSTVLACDPKSNRIIAQDINVQKKNVKARSAQQPGGIVSKEGPIDASNVMVVCPKCNKATRVAMAEVKGKKVRVCKKCGAELTFKTESKKKAPAKKTSAKKTTAKATEDSVEA